MVFENSLIKPPIPVNFIIVPNFFFPYCSDSITAGVYLSSNFHNVDLITEFVYDRKEFYENLETKSIEWGNAKKSKYTNHMPILLT